MRATAALAALCLLSAGARAAPAALFLIPTVTPPGLALDAGRPLRIAAHARDPGALARLLGAAAPPAGATRLELTLGAYPQLARSSGHDVRAASFVVDFDEPAVEALRTALVARHGAHPTRAQLVAFVDASIAEKSLERGWDVASRTAHDRVGDCTEHAVLLTALARSVGVPARVALGIAIVEVDGTLQSFGHAWAELAEGARWVVADAALASEDVRVHYLPFGVLEEEGPGFEVDVLRLTPVWVQRVEILGNAPPD